MIINILDLKKKKRFEIVTIDIRTRQIRLIKKHMGLIDFIEISHSEAEAYEKMYNDKDIEEILSCISNDYLGFQITEKDVSVNVIKT